MKSNLRFSPIFLFLFFGSIYAFENDPTFPVPDVLKSNVEFWKKIYTEIPLDGGVLHDRDYPLVIYKKIIGNADPAKIKQGKEQITQSLNIINTQPESTWSADEKAIFELFKAHAPEGALEGAVERIRFQRGQADRFREGLQRSGMYLDTVKAILKQYGVPARLAYLPHVESSFNTAAYSKVGAAGLWQFMRGTGKLFGMNITYTIDERRDPVKATIAAAKYLSSAYKQLGDWPLAITSYNHGLYGMKRAVAQTGSTDIGVIIQKYDSKSFKFASTNFYSCFLAASEIAEHYTTYFPNLTIQPRLKYSDITLDHYISPDVLCKYLKVPTQTLITLNPAVRPVIFEQQKQLPKGFVIHVPSNIPENNAILALSQIPDSLKSSEPERPQYYRVNKGDNLYSIANRLGISVKELAVENNINKYNRLREGEVLRVPGHAQGPSLAVSEPIQKKSSATTQTAKTESCISESASNEAVVEMAQAEIQQTLPPEEAAHVEKKKELIPLPEPVQSKSNNAHISTKTNQELPKKSQEHTPEPLSDSLKEIALAPAIAEKNTSPSERPSISPDFDVALYNLDAELSSAGSSAKITVSIDETIGHYADWLGIATWKIRKLNDMGRTSDIRINRKLLIPINGQDALEKFVATRLEYHMAIEEDFYSQYKVSDTKSRELKKGESLWDICNEGDSPIPMWLLKKYNKQLDLTKLLPGTIIWIPVISEKTEKDLQNEPVKKNPSKYSTYIQPVRKTFNGAELMP